MTSAAQDQFLTTETKPVLVKRQFTCYSDDKNLTRVTQRISRSLHCTFTLLMIAILQTNPGQTRTPEAGLSRVTSDLDKDLDLHLDQVLTLLSLLKALAAVLREARQQHPELSVTRVVVHKETEGSPDRVVD